MTVFQCLYSGFWHILNIAVFNVVLSFGSWSCWCQWATTFKDHEQKKGEEKQN